MKSNPRYVALLTLFVFVSGLAYAPPANAGSHIFVLASVPANVLYSASTCQQANPPIGGVPQWPTIYYAAHRKSTRARGLLAIQYVAWNGQWIEVSRYETRTWNNGVAIYGFPGNGTMIRMYAIVAVPKVGDVAYPITNQSFTIPYSCG
ncbi:MAG: hypothetical protein KA144_01975 [Xanthomonadaceae bacterium]|nr:hypothetical protein [Xanthomonadaceae bacterium]